MPSSHCNFVSDEGRRKRDKMRLRQERRGPAPLASSEDMTVDKSQEQSHENVSMKIVKAPYCDVQCLVSHNPQIHVSEVGGTDECASMWYSSQAKSHSDLLHEKYINSGDINNEEETLRRSSGSSLGSELILPLSGRSSRHSSLASNGSGRRSSSPFRTRLETSFCGNRPTTSSADLQEPVASARENPSLSSLIPQSVETNECDKYEIENHPDAASQMDHAHNSLSGTSVKITCNVLQKDCEVVVVLPDNFQTIYNQHAKFDDSELILRENLKTDEANISNTIISIEDNENTKLSSFKGCMETKNCQDTCQEKISESEANSRLEQQADIDEQEALLSSVITVETSTSENVPGASDQSMGTSEQDRNMAEDVSQCRVSNLTSDLPEARLSKTSDTDSSDSARCSASIESSIPASTTNVADISSRDCCVSQSESQALFEDSDDELPYVPTTLPQELSQQCPILSISKRSSQRHRNTSLERPRTKSNVEIADIHHYIELSQAETKCRPKIIVPQDSLGLYRAEHQRKTMPWKNFAADGLKSVECRGKTHTQTIPYNYTDFHATVQEKLIPISSSEYNENHPVRFLNNEIYSLHNKNDQTLIANEVKEESEDELDVISNKNSMNAKMSHDNAPNKREKCNNCGCEKDCQIEKSEHDLLHAYHSQSTRRSPVEIDEHLQRKEEIRSRAESISSVLHHKSAVLADAIQDAHISLLQSLRKGSSPIGKDLTVGLSPCQRSRASSCTSARSCSASPQKIIMETSFCGSRPVQVSDTVENQEVIEQSHACLVTHLVSSHRCLDECPCSCQCHNSAQLRPGLAHPSTEPNTLTVGKFYLGSSSNVSHCEDAGALAREPSPKHHPEMLFDEVLQHDPISAHHLSEKQCANLR